MTPKKLSFVDFQNAIMAPGITSGNKTLNTGRDKLCEMWVGMDPGFVTVHMPNGEGEMCEFLVPLSNVKSAVVVKEKAVTKTKK